MSEDATIAARIMQLEHDGRIDPKCGMCQREIYPKLWAGKLLWEVFCPPHQASARCQSGRYAHCTCDTCF